jgi:outer membrane lipopolysaccharide assembly protein LptE/RlpB
MRSLARISLALVGILVFTGCGYHLVGGKRGLAGIDSVAIRTPRNDSYQPGVEYLVADALRREFLRRGGAALNEDPDDADLVISGRVESLSAEPRSLSSVVLVLEYEVTLTLDLVARRRDGSELPIEGQTLRESERFLSSADVEAERKNRIEAIRRVSQILATRFFDSIAEVMTQ